MEAGESSGAKPCDEVWAKLVPSDSRYPDVEIRLECMVICSDITCSSPKKHEWCKITRNLDLCSATLQNLSSETIIVDETVLGREGTMVINCGSEVISGPSRDGYLCYKFEVMPTQELCNRRLEISLDVENAKCSICLNIWHDVVTVAPCLHNFCNGCFSEWLRWCQEKRSSVLCPQCRAVVCYVGRNHFLHNIEENILQSYSSLKRSSDEVAALDAQASIKSNLVVRTGKTRRKRPYSPPNEESIGPEFPCPQCGLGCDRAFCAAYWQALGVVGSDFHTVCIPGSFKPISEYAISRIPFSAHQNNPVEQDITERCIRQTGKTLQDIISDWIVKLNNREIDRTRMPLNHAEMITSRTHFCNDCYEKLVSYLLYWFRVSVPKYLLPPDASQREDCWYGYTCRTQHHSEEHRRRRNHVCRPTRGSNI
ncbi:E3 ubiquitin-protein ligase CHFR isoform X2 [Telopea speciosissima]|uniref:E3 ubiquitin-protein ligase CHFR isoform X2 n=1 Tax=Telopea speciosissima TaxID=54955 RepID=UPI001CC7E220|nr:E3 ubiquitin-protein ligase CHFR isoform X2 [Telopea speciosissima]